MVIHNQWKMMHIKSLPERQVQLSKQKKQTFVQPIETFFQIMKKKLSLNVFLRK